MGRPTLFDRPLTNVEMQARHRARTKVRAALAKETMRFVLALRLDRVPPRTLTALQRKLQEIRL